jgi:hypothetical protein
MENKNAMKKQIILWGLLITSSVIKSQNIFPASGNVGIGTTSPAKPLHIQTSVSGWNEVASFVNASGTGRPYITIGKTAPLSIDGGLSLGYDATNNFAFLGLGGDDPSTGIGIILKRYGRVGINTTSPEDFLQIGSGINKTVFGSAAGAYLGYGTSYLGLNASRQNSSSWSTYGDGAHNGGGVIYGNVYGDIYFATIPNTGGSNQSGLSDATIVSNIKLRINANGIVQIGTQKSQSHPNSKLHVNGTIACQEIYVTATGDWADYVLKKDYKLMPLENLENYIQKNHHLPNVPSEDEMKANGGSLGELSKIQMEKIEELTLYIIELKKEIDLLKQKKNSKH